MKQYELKWNVFSLWFGFMCDAKKKYTIFWKILEKYGMSCYNAQGILLKKHSVIGGISVWKIICGWWTTINWIGAYD